MAYSVTSGFLKTFFKKAQKNFFLENLMDVMNF